MKPAKNYICELCKRETPYLEVCNYCNKKICRACEKAGATHTKILHTVICRSCWGDLKKRTRWKSL